MGLWSELRVSVVPHHKIERKKSVRKFIDLFPSLQGQDYSVSDLEDNLFILRLDNGGEAAYNILNSLHQGLVKEFSIAHLYLNIRII